MDYKEFMSTETNSIDMQIKLAIKRHCHDCKFYNKQTGCKKKRVVRICKKNRLKNVD